MATSTSDGAPKPILPRKVLIVEGEDERRFFTPLLEHLGIGDVDVRPIGGKDQICRNLRLLALPSPGFARGRALGVTHFLPIDERHTYSKEYCEAVLARLMGGRAAEEVIFGEITPKAVAIRHPQMVALWLYPLIRIFKRLFFPLTWLLSHVLDRMLLRLFGEQKGGGEAIDDLKEMEGLSGIPSIKVRSYVESDFLVIEVIDNGIGIEKDKLEAIFRSDYTTKKDGSGLGLHSIANFVEACGGQIQALSNGIGKGATMRITLPMSSENS